MSGKKSLCEECFENMYNNLEGRCDPPCDEVNEYITTDCCPYGWYHKEDYSLEQIKELIF